MSDLFMNKQRRRQRWQNFHQQSTAAAAATDAASSSPATTMRTSRFSRASTPGATSNPLNDDYLDLDDDSDDAEEQEAVDDLDDDPLANILSLQLRKPEHWKWELTTSKSCSNIALPRILLYDHKGNLLVDAPPGGGKDTSEQVYKQEDYQKPRPPQDRTKKRPYNQQRAVTTNLTHSVRKALEKEFDGLQIQEVTTPTSRSSGERKRQLSLLTATPSTTSTNTTMRPHRSRKPIDFNIRDLPDMSPRSSSLKGVRFNVDEESKITDFLPTPPSTTTPTSSSSGPREKRKYRRSQSTGRPSSRSESILERRSYQKGRLSSPESEGENGETETGPRYFLSTDEAGTLMVHQDSSSSQNSRRRRKPQKHIASSDSINKSQTPQQMSPSIQLSEASTSNSTKERRRKQLPIRRNLTDGNMLSDKRLSSSEERVAAKPKVIYKKEEPPVTEPEPPVQAGACNCIHHRRYRRNETKDLNPSISALGLQRNGKIR